MSSFRTRKLEELRGHGKPLFGRLGPLEERFHGLCRHLVADGGVGPSSVVVRLDELDDGVLGVGPGGEARSAVHLVLQSGEERLGHGVVVAVAGAAAGKAHVVGPRPLGQGPAGVLGAPGRNEKWRFRPRSRATSRIPGPPRRCRRSSVPRATS